MKTSDMNLQDIMAVLAQTATMIEKSRKEFDSKLEESRKEAEKSREESRKEFEQKLEESRKEFEQSKKEAEKRSKDLDQKIGRLSNRIGELVESMMGANIHRQFNEKFNFHFEEASPNHTVDNDELDIHLEVDLFLANEDSEMLIEVKTKYSQNDIDKHIERVSKLKRHNLARHNYRKVYAAAAGGIMSKEVKKYAMQKGFYILELNGDNINIEQPPTVKIW